MADKDKKKIAADTKVELSAGLVTRKTKARAALLTIPLTVVNTSTHDVQQGGTWGVKDESVTPQVAQTATFSQIPRGASQTQNVSLPTGFEWGIFRFEAADGSGEWAGVHGGSNAPSGRLTLTD